MLGRRPEASWQEFVYSSESKYEERIKPAPHVRLRILVYTSVKKTRKRRHKAPTGIYSYFKASRGTSRLAFNYLFSVKAATLSSPNKIFNVSAMSVGKEKTDTRKRKLKM